MSKYRPTPSEEKLLKVLLDPNNLGKSITEKCKIAGVARNTYYDALKKPKFTALLKDVSFVLLKGILPDIINASYDNAITPQGHLDRKMLLTLGGYIAEKPIVDVNFNNNLENFSTEDLEKILKEVNNKSDSSEN